jgi:hypothetical protein
LNFINYDKNVDLSNSLYIFHQNVRGLRSKSEELINSLVTDNINPHIPCFSEHDMEEQELQCFTLTGYALRSSFCCKHLKGGGGCIFVCEDMNVYKINITHKCRKKDLEICAVEIETETSKLIVLSLYRAPTGDFKHRICWDRITYGENIKNKQNFRMEARFVWFRTYLWLL